MVNVGFVPQDSFGFKASFLRDDFHKIKNGAGFAKSFKYQGKALAIVKCPLGGKRNIKSGNEFGPSSAAPLY